MPRRAGVPKRDVLPDPKFNSKVVTKLINQVMYDGKKSTAEGIVYGAFDIVEKKLNQPAIDVFTKALENVMPAVEVKARRVGGSTYQVPLDIRADRRQTLGIRWMTLYARKRGEKKMDERLAGEIMDAFNSTGGFFYCRENPGEMEAYMAFFTSAIDTLQTLVVALGAGLGVWGVVNLLEGYGSDNPGANAHVR